MALTPEEWTNQGSGTAGAKLANQNQGTYVVERLKELADNPSWNEGHGDWKAVTSLYNNFSRLYGRGPTQSEINQLAPVYLQDQNLGNQALEQSFQAYKQSPEYLKSQAGNYGSQVGELIKGTLGRDATADEVQHFGQLMAGGDVDAYTLGTFLKQQPEYTQKQDKAFRGELSGELQAQDQRYFQESVLPSIQSQMLKSGRSVDSSGYATALAQAANSQNRDREGFLRNLTASQYQNQTANARQDYMSQLQRYYGGQDYNRDRAAQLSDRSYARANELQNFNIQRQTYEEYLRKYGKRSSGIGSTIGGIAGLAAGAYATKSPQGAMLGYQAGSGLGNAAEGWF